ncbi:hypothetical protein G7085_02450 [Tessaracoccus sp. HDW20]|uniref:hypothetical protein n=1 Tax=Tessaracoccus coleopterorum TaxID=2714950 RepID=UPI0018D288E7|nr:hypothetical protein [Tessaracoccus coleopterorum]NHB83916.1 hypothetical protein [Tessaracoccus coleopterorum]
MITPTRAARAWLAPAAAALLALVAGAAIAVRPGLLDGPTGAPSLALVAGCLPVGAFLVAQRPANRVGALLTLVGLTALLALGTAAATVAGPGGWLSEWAWWLPWPPLMAAICLYPEGRRVGRTRRRLTAAVLVSGAVAAACLAVAVFLSPGC